MMEKVEPQEQQTQERVSTASFPIQATGRRKESVAQVRLFAGAGDIQVNGKLLKDYFRQAVYNGNHFLS